MTETILTPPAIPEEKPFWQSKTLWAGLLAAVIPFFPPVAVWVAANPALYSAVLGGVFGGLRLVTKNKITIN